MRRKLIELGVLQVLEGLGVDIRDPDFKKTPERVARMYHELLSPPKVRWSMFPAQGYSEMIVHKAHSTWGMCPHHLLPIEMEVSVGYIPRQKKGSYVPGLSKIPRLVEQKARRLVIQEKVSVEVVDEMMKRLKLLGAGCFIRGKHLCMTMRGVKSSGVVITSALRGVFLDKPEVRTEFLALVMDPRNTWAS